MKIIRIDRDELKKAGLQWWNTRPESRIATFIAGTGIIALCAGIALYLIRNPLCFAFLATGPILFLVALLFDLIGGKAKK